MSAEERAYLDSSALLKLVVAEPETTALRAHLASSPGFISCALARVEVVRNARRHGTAAVTRARALLGGIDLVNLDDRLLDHAATLGNPPLRSLDAVHVAAAQSLGDDLRELITYDLRMAAAASDLGLPVAAPGS